MMYDLKIDLSIDNSCSQILRRIKPGSLVLEFGPATGYMTNFMKNELGCTVYCVEIDREAAELAGSFAEKIIIADIDNISEWQGVLAGLSFEYIIFADVLEHLRDPWKVLNSATAMLKPQGQILISLPNIGHNAIIMDLIEGKFNYRKEGLLDNTHIRFFTRESAAELLEKADLCPVEWSATYMKPENTEFKQYYSFFPEAVSKFLENRADAHVYQFIIVAKRKSDVRPEECILESNKTATYLNNDLLQIYWSENGDFSEKYSVNSSMKYGSEFIVYEIMLPHQAYGKIRLDPGNLPAYGEIKSITLTSESEDKGREKLNLRWSAQNKFFGLKPGPGVIELENGETYSFLSINNDPQLFFNDIPRPSGEGTSWVLRLEMRISQQIPGEILNRMSSINRRLAENDEQIRNQAAELAIMEDKLNEFRHSLSWRLTLPLRLARRLMRKLMKGFAESGAPAVSNHVKYRTKPAVAETESKVDVIIPIYNAYEDVVACVESVLANTSGAAYRLILVDDASPDPRISLYFSQLKARGLDNLVLLRNEVNLGFVGTANRGLEISVGHVVLLNSDTEVPAGWLERLIATVQNNPGVGTVTPFSNNATICSFPNFCQDNQLPEGYDLNSLDRVFASYAPLLILDIPTAVGFCMFITSQCLDKVGLLDEITFGRGYGEENDFCMRAEKLGFRNVLCPNLFVHHKGSMSFGMEQKTLLQKNLQKLSRKHPDYLPKVQRFVTEDPIRPVRQVIQYAISKPGVEKPHSGVLHILHNQGGGTEVHVEDLIQNTKQSIRVYKLISYPEKFVFTDRNVNPPLTYSFSTDIQTEDPAWLKKISQAFGINLIHVHQLIGYPASFMESITNIDVPYIFTAHDYFAACPMHNLLNPNSVYCLANNDTNICQQCLRKQKDRSISGINIREWRTRWLKFLQGAELVLAPSAAAADIMAKYYPGINIKPLEHGVDAIVKDVPVKTALPFSVKYNYKLRVALLGAIGPHKGSGLLEKLINICRDRNIPIQWVVVGYTDLRPNAYISPDYRLIIHGPYKKEEVPALLKSYGIDLVLLPAIWPETYSYTLSEAWLAGYPVMATGLGALRQRLEDTGAGWILENLEVENIISQLTELINKPERILTAKEKARQVRLTTLQEMGEIYLGIYSDLAKKATVQKQEPAEEPFSLIERISMKPILDKDAKKCAPLRYAFRIARKLRHIMKECSQ